jgi:exopolysaccharide biosynthesis polyprenyl glycosylphosphotransferase
MLLDALAITVAALVASQIRFATEVPLPRLWYGVMSAALPPIWVVLMAANRAYERRFLGLGAEEFQRVFGAAIAATAVVATTCYALQFNLARGYVAIALPLGTVLTLLFRYAARKVVHARRRGGSWSHRALAVGDRAHVAELIEHVHREAYAGVRFVGACVPGQPDPIVVSGVQIPVVASLTGVADAVRLLSVDTVAVTACPAVTGGTLRRLAWELEGSDVDLVVAPALTDIAGPGISVRPVAGLPLLHVHEPEFTGARRIAKGAADRSLAALALIVLTPLLLLLAMVIRLTSPGPALFRQTRVGKGGSTFTCYKLRTMVATAEVERERLIDLNERSEGLLFKIRRDPRVTPVGRWLRRYSFDELSQLWNIARGDMSLVGPRPPLPIEVDAYGHDVRRRLLVKPGLTGLWQISGRSDLPWTESVRLDLFYVENWSPFLDLSILWKTAFAVLRGSGAY